VLCSLVSVHVYEYTHTQTDIYIHTHTWTVNDSLPCYAVQYVQYFLALHEFVYQLMIVMLQICQQHRLQIMDVVQKYLMSKGMLLMPVSSKCVGSPFWLCVLVVQPNCLMWIMKYTEFAVVTVQEMHFCTYALHTVNCADYVAWQILLVSCWSNHGKREVAVWV
jgi:hypothetical protein